jgi:S-adenosylmethionine-diacylglycerol 3-amino-3-carboxypropyl transferase
VRASRVQRLSAFQQVVYSGCWEDTETELAALDLQKGARVLSITASGSRSLGLLEANPSEVISVDLNPSQNFLLDLKRASALGARDWEQHASFLGLLPTSTAVRRSQYVRVRRHLEPDARAYWDGRDRAITRGVTNIGRQDRIVATGASVAWRVLPESKLRPLFEMDDLEEQAQYFDAHIDTPVARSVARLATSKWALRWIYGKDLYEQAGFFAMGEMIFENIAKHAHARLMRENFFLSRVLLGEYIDPQKFNSYYLRESAFQEFRERSHAINPVTAPLEEVLAGLPDNSLDGLSLSDIFDWIAPRDFDRLLHEIVRVAKDGARLCYRICLVDRQPGAEHAEHLKADRALSARLHVLDRSCFYRDLYVGTVRK